MCDAEPRVERSLAASRLDRDESATGDAGSFGRAAEVKGLRIRDVVLTASDTTGAHVEVRQMIKRVGGVRKGGTPKSARSRRDVPLLDRPLIADLRLFLLMHPNSGDPDALCWPARRNGSRRLDFSRNIDCGSVLQYYMRPLLPDLGLPPKMRWHDLRHTYASLMLAAGIQPYKLSRWMGTPLSSQRTRSMATCTRATTALRSPRSRPSQGRRDGLEQDSDDVLDVRFRLGDARVVLVRVSALVASVQALSEDCPLRLVQFAEFSCDV